MGKGDFWVLALGFIGLLALSELSKPQCPHCNKRINRGVQNCPHCGAYLQWRDDGGRF